MGNSAIEWTDKVWNPVTGCTKVSQGCKNCYAERVFPRPYPGRAFTDVRTHPDRLEDPLCWRKPAKIFVNSMSDLFHESVPDQFITDVFGIMALAHWHSFQVLTKRPQRMLEYLAGGDHGILAQFAAIQVGGGIGPKSMFRALDIKRRDSVDWAWPLPNVWLGVSVEDQATADERIPLLLNTPAAVRFISAEPLLGWIVLHEAAQPEVNVDWLRGFDGCDPAIPGLDWVIVGGESGPKARAMQSEWAQGLRLQCQAANVPFFFKQWGEWLGGSQDGNPDVRPQSLNSSDQAVRVGKLAAGRLLDGVEWNEFPQ